MNRKISKHTRIWRAIVACTLLPALAFGVRANPNGMSVSSGSASATGSAGQLTINASHNAVINWNSFNIALGETTTFVQPSAASVVWNRINDSVASQIHGNLNANGFVVLFNQHGFYFGPNSVVNVGGMLVSTAPVIPTDFTTGGMWQFTGPPPAASIINYGQINAARGGSVFLIAEKIENHGVLSAPDGTLGLYAGKEVLVSERPDGRGISANVRLPEGSVDNNGKLVANAGTIALHAQVVNQNGLIEATSALQRNGYVELIGSDAVNLGANSRIDASGGTGAADAGSVLIKSDRAFTDSASSHISVAGGATGGRAGVVEISATELPAIHSHIDGHSVEAGKGGKFVIDPLDIVLGSSGDGATSGGVVGVDQNPGTTLNLNVFTAFTGFSQIALQASRNITLKPNTVWDLNTSTGVSDPGSLLTLQAGNDIVIGNGSGITAGPGWSMQLVAGASDFSSPASTAVTPGVGNIYLNGSATGTGSGYLLSKEGSIRLFAGKDMLVGRGYVNTLGGGNIEVSALSGTVNTGTKVDGYTFSDTGYEISFENLGGISTGHGGNVSITAGTDIISLLPGAGNTTANSAASGAFGAEPGNVTLTAGRRIQGSYVVRNGTGIMNAGVTSDGTQITSVFAPDADIGSSTKPVALNLVSGQWQLWAARNIYLQEARNPSGVFNDNYSAPVYNGVALPPAQVGVPNLSDYAPDASVKLVAGNSVQLLGTSLPRTVTSMAPTYPPNLEIQAGAGGVSINRTMVLFPSPQGNLEITTTAGGSLRGVLATPTSLIMSDSSSADFTTFANGHSDPPLHFNDTQPVRLTIDGNIENLFLQTPKQTLVDVHGNALNFGFLGQNLHAGDVSRINVQGNLINLGDRAFVNIASTPDFSVLNPDLGQDPYTSIIGGKVTYDSSTHQLGFIGRMTTTDLEYLLSPHLVQTLDSRGLPVFDSSGNLVYHSASLTTDTTVINQLYALSQFIPGFRPRGYRIGGPGKLIVSANDIDLGTSDGIQSIGPLVNPALGKLSQTGADLQVDLAGNLSMISSRIASFNGGDIDVTTAGSINVGSQQSFSSSDVPKGIFSSAGSPVTVIADGDVNINGSRIATYDGGTLTVISRNGDVNAGSGGLGFVLVDKIVTAEDGTFRREGYTIPGSGILATALPGSTRTVGDVTVEATHGDIIANSGGVIQLPFNDSSASAGLVKLKAGGNIDANNSGVIGANIQLDAGGSITGLVVSRGDINIAAQQNVAVTAVAQGNVSVTAGAAVSGTIVAVGSVSADAGSISGTIASATGGTSLKGDSAAATGVQATQAARSDSKVSDDADKKVMAKKSDEEEDDQKKKKPGPILAKTTGRVTVILPNQK